MALFRHGSNRATLGDPAPRLVHHYTKGTQSNGRHLPPARVSSIVPSPSTLTSSVNSSVNTYMRSRCRYRNHGFDNAEEDMHAIFVASGPSFKPLPSSSLISPPMDPAPGEGHLGPIPPTLYPSRASSPSGPSGPAGQNEAVMEASRWSLASRDQFATANYNMPNLRNLELYGLVAHVLGIPEKARAPTNVSCLSVCLLVILLHVEEGRIGSCFITTRCATPFSP